MKIKNIKDVEAFLATVDKCNGDIILTSVYGDKLNLKSRLTQYIAIAKLLGEYGEELELWCSDKNDKSKFFEMFAEYPEMV